MNLKRNQPLMDTQGWFKTIDLNIDAPEINKRFTKVDSLVQ